MADETKLIEKAVGGDRQALGELLMRHRQSVFALTVALTGNRQDAEDAAQEACVSAVRGIERFNPTGSFQAWLLKLARSTAIDLIRSRGARRARELRLAAEARMISEGSPERKELITAMHAALMALEERYRLPVMLQHCQGLSHGEIAEILDLPPGTVATRVFRGLERLREALARAGFACAGLSATLAQLPQPIAPDSLLTAIDHIARGRAGAIGGLGTGIAKGGLIVKIGLGVAAAGIVAGTMLWAVGGSSAEPEAKPAPAASVTAPYDPTAQPDFKGPEVVSGPDEPAIPGGAFRKEKYAFAQINGNFLDGSRESCMAHNYCESVWWLDDNTVAFGDNIMNMVMILDGDRLYRFAGSGVRGDKDGPAECAEFSFGVYVAPHPGLARADNGDFFITDPMNGKLKKIFKKPDGRWWVQTIAGGGKKKLKTGEVADNPFDVEFWGGGPHHLQLRGPKRDHVYVATGASNWRCTFLMYPDGKVKCLSEGGNKDIPLDIPGDKEAGYYYTWRGGHWASTCWKISRVDGSEVKVVGYTDAEIKAKEATGWKRPWDGPVDDCCIWTSGGPLRPDGRAMYLIGGDQLHLRRVMNGRIMSLETHTGKWVESRERALNPNSIGCMNISRLTWDGYAYMTYAYGGQGMYRAKLYEPLKKPEGK